MHSTLEYPLLCPFSVNETYKIHICRFTFVSAPVVENFKFAATVARCSTGEKSRSGSPYDSFLGLVTDA